MKPDDQRLQMLLRAWKAPEPRADFEANVWNRIKQQSVEAIRPAPLFFVVREWLVSRPAWTSAAAAAAGLVIGLNMAFAIPHAPVAAFMNSPLLDSRTVAGSYLGLLTEGAR